MNEEKSSAPEPEEEKHPIPKTVRWYIVSLLLIGIPIGFYDVRLGFIVPGALVWLDLFVSTTIDTIGGIRVQVAFAKWRKPHDRSGQMGNRRRPAKRIDPQGT